MKTLIGLVNLVWFGLICYFAMLVSQLMGWGPLGVVLVVLYLLLSRAVREQEEQIETERHEELINAVRDERGRIEPTL